MATQQASFPHALTKRVMDVQKPSDPTGLTIEAWAQGYMVGSLIIMACVAFANMRKKVLLHKLILVEARTIDFTDNSQDIVHMDHG
jgi:hypothetical protein